MRGISLDGPDSSWQIDIQLTSVAFSLSPLWWTLFSVICDVGLAYIYAELVEGEEMSEF